MTDLIEKMARAHCCGLGDCSLAPHKGTECKIDEAGIEDMQAAASVLLKAMMEPTNQALEDAGMMEGYETDYPGSTDQNHIDWWQAMLKAFASANNIPMEGE